MIQKQTDQMYYLLQICLTLHPQSIDESVTRSMNEKLGTGDRLQKLQRGGIGGPNAEEDFLSEMEQLFLFACPKFISPTLPNFSEKKDNHRDMLVLQQRVKNDPLRSIYNFQDSTCQMSPRPRTVLSLTLATPL